MWDNPLVSTWHDVKNIPIGMKHGSVHLVLRQI